MLLLDFHCKENDGTTGAAQLIQSFFGDIPLISGEQGAWRTTGVWDVSSDFRMKLIKIIVPFGKWFISIRSYLDLHRYQWVSYYHDYPVVWYCYVFLIEMHLVYHLLQIIFQCICWISKKFINQHKLAVNAFKDYKHKNTVG